MRMRRLFGPVDSRRLGRSLGIDLLPYKTCSFDCVYCECGRTTDLRTARAEFVPAAEVCAELDAYLADGPALDWITFSGSGEPSLHSGIGRVVAHLKERHPGYRVCVLTNATLLGDPELRAELARADLVVPTLNAVGRAAFDTICRPATGVDPLAIAAGVKALKALGGAAVVVETFVVPGVNDTPGELAALRAALLDIAPDAVQLNRLDRRGSDDWVEPASPARLRSIADFLAPLNVQVVRERRPAEQEGQSDPAVAAALGRALADGPADIRRLSILVGLGEGLLAKQLGWMALAGTVAVELAADGRERYSLRRQP